MHLHSRLSLTLLVGACASLSMGGVLHPSLRESMAGMTDTSTIRVMARLADRADLQAIDIGLKRGRATRQERHQLMVGILQTKASSTQGPLVHFLEESPEQVSGIRSYWIDNMVEFSGTRRIIEAVADRPDVEVVFIEPQIFFDPPEDMSYAPDHVQFVEAGVRAIRAPRLWDIGVTGQGSIVMNIDTGVKGDHAALASRWRGALPGVPPQQAWYHPSGSTFPVDSDNPGHGTHTMGIMTGCNPLTGDTVGVAPGATWIAGSGSYVGAFQWAADPDGNPFTLTDVPDVINCSWFTGGDPCGGGAEYWTLMDNVELVGAVVIWSAGNCGPGGGSSSCVAGVSPGPYMTITPPKNRVSSDVNAFAVGAVDGNNATYPIASFSSRGPSACDTTIIKPEVSAPGISVRSTIANGSYGSMSGTSMAAPHVSGAVALLRQVNPNADADQIKLALLMSARDLGTPGEDNTYGMGLIDVFAAAELVTPYRLTGTVRAAGSGVSLANARIAILQTGQERKSDSSGAYLIGPLRDTVQVRFSAFAFRDTTMSVILTPDVPLTLDVDLAALPLYPVAGSVTDSGSGAGISAQVRWFAQGDSSAGPMYTVSTQPDGAYTLQAVTGSYRVEVVPPAPYPDQVAFANVIVTTSGAAFHVSLSRAYVVMVDDDRGASYDTLYRKSLQRLGLSTRTVSLAAGSAVLDTVLGGYTAPPVLVWFTGSDSSAAMTPEERRIMRGHLTAGGNAIITGQNIAQFSPPGDTLLESFLGIQFTGNTTQIFLRGFTGDVIGNGVNFLLSGGVPNQNSKDALQIIAGSTGIPSRTLYYGADTTSLAGVRVLGPGAAWAAVYFAFGLEGLPASRMDTLLVRSFRYFDNPVLAVEGPGAPGLPGQLALGQNYPNPFNGETKIGYRLEETGNRAWMTLKVYDVLGREVATLVNGVQEPGAHVVGFTAVNLPSGVYIYRLQSRPVTAGETGGVAMQRKMLLLK
jgi:subtilisin family serine protease